MGVQGSTGRKEGDRDGEGTKRQRKRRVGKSIKKQDPDKTASLELTF